MKYARIQIEGTDKPLVVDAAGFVRVRDEHPKADLKPCCIECGQSVFLNDEKGARGFRIVNSEITKRGQIQKNPGFSHHKGNSGKDCSRYFASDPRFKSFHEDNSFDILEKQRNLDVLSQKGMMQSLADVETYFMHRLTGQPQISSEDRQALDNVQKKLHTWIGLADYPWVLAYITPVLMGSRNKTFKNGIVRRLEYKGVGIQMLPVKSLDGEERYLRIPRKIQLCFSRKDGKEPNPLLKDGYPVEFPVSREFAHNIAVHENRLRRVVHESEQPVLPVAGGIGTGIAVAKPIQLQLL